MMRVNLLAASKGPVIEDCCHSLRWADTDYMLHRKAAGQTDWELQEVAAVGLCSQSQRQQRGKVQKRWGKLERQPP